MWDVRAWLALAVVCSLGVVLAARGLGDETAVSLDGDMARYLMNGVFLHDVLHDLPFTAPLEYAQRYYARYPALSLGHHPLLPALAQVPFFLVFGVSVFAARLSTLVAMALMLIFWFRLIREIYDVPTAFFASLLLVTTPGLIPLFQVVLAEPFALSLIVLSVFFMHRYCASERPRDAVAFAVCVVLSGYAKQLSAFLFPVYAFQFASTFGVRALFRRSTLLVIAAMALCLFPIVPLTLKYSPFNVMLVTDFDRPGGRISGNRLLLILSRLWRGQLGLSVPLLVIGAVSFASAALRRDRRLLWFAVWMALVYAQQVLLGITNDRFAVYWLPAVCALGAAAYHVGQGPRWRTVWAVVLTATAGYQLWSGSQPIAGRSAIVRPVGAGGYEEAARAVTEQPLGDTVLYSAAVDTGYFVFFVRKHDADRERIVLRADKVLTTSRMGRLDVGRRIGARDEILPILKRYGVGYVVVEDGTYPEGPLRWLQDVVQTPDFELRERFAIESGDRRLRQATLSVYAYLGRTPADADASLSMDIPVVTEHVQVRLADLIGERQADRGRR